MKILLTNDDGINAPGLKALEDSLPSGMDYLVIAPDSQRSECSHSVTTRHQLRLNQVGPNRWSLNGTPVDCVRVAIATIAPDLGGVLSGVNDGGNLGADIYISGTAAAAREAALHGFPAVAISQYRKPTAPRTWDHVPHWLADRLLPLLWECQRERKRDELIDFFWNVNLPAISDDAESENVASEKIPDVVHTKMDRHPMPLGYTSDGDLLTYKGDYHGRPRVPGTDVNECFAGKISISRIKLA